MATKGDSPSSEESTSTKSVTLKLVLKCTDTRSESVREINLPTLPLTTGELKTAIENSCNVPACVQDLSFESHPLCGRDDVKLARIRNGDTITVRYLAEGDCKEVVEVISWMGIILAILKQENPTIYRGMSESLNDLVTHAIEFEHIENLAFNYFFPWLDAKKYANKLHFVNNGGLEIIMELYSLLQRESWGVCILKMKYLEYGILRVLWNLSESFALRRAIIRLGGLDMCMRSLMRDEVIKGEVIIDRLSPKGANQDWILIETICAALGTLCKYITTLLYYTYNTLERYISFLFFFSLSELPEVHMPIATEPKVLYQLICISLSPSVRVMSPILVATMYLCLAATPDTHRHIATVGVTGLLEVCGQERDPKGDKQKEMGNLLLK